jgi:protein-disulfide isomerase
MNRSLISKGIAIAMASLMGFSATVSADTAIQKKEVQTIVHDYIVQNPEVLVQSLQSFQQKQMEQTQKSFTKIQEMAPKFSDRLFHQTTDPVAGNPKGTVTLVEFSDYQCGHCITMSAVVDALIKKNPNLRVVMKEFPIRGPISEVAAKAAIAAQKQGKYYDLRVALMDSKNGTLTEDNIYTIAKSVGLDVEKLKTDMKSADVQQQIKNNHKLAQDLKLMFTPVFFIAKSDINSKSSPDSVVFIPGGVDIEQLNQAIAKLSS